MPLEAPWGWICLSSVASHSYQMSNGTWQARFPSLKMASKCVDQVADVAPEQALPHAQVRTAYGLKGGFSVALAAALAAATKEELRLMAGWGTAAGPSAVRRNITLHSPDTSEHNMLAVLRPDASTHTAQAFTCCLCMTLVCARSRQSAKAGMISNTQACLRETAF